MFKLIENGPERGDCTAPYKVMFYKSYTVSEFIYEILKNRSSDWGYIGIYSPGDIFGNPRCAYRYGKVDIDLPAEYMNKEIISAMADGGWSRMDYILQVKGDLDDSSYI